MKENEEILKTIQKENHIFIVYLIIIGLAYWANLLETDYYTTGNSCSKDKYQKLMIIVFSLAVIISFIFLRSGYESYKKLTPCDTENKKTFESLSLLATGIVFVAGIIFLFVAVYDRDLETEFTL